MEHVVAAGCIMTINEAKKRRRKSGSGPMVVVGTPINEPLVPAADVGNLRPAKVKDFAGLSHSGGSIKRRRETFVFHGNVISIWSVSF